jgi:hypothetical protein
MICYREELLRDLDGFQNKRDGQQLGMPYSVIKEIPSEMGRQNSKCVFAVHNQCIG